MSFYLDTNVIVALFRDEPGSAAAVRWLSGAQATVLIGDFGAIEFAAVLSREVRTGALETDRAHAILAKFDIWRNEGVDFIAIGPGDMQLAEMLVREFATKLQAPDALHLAIAITARSVLVTLDLRLPARRGCGECRSPCRSRSVASSGSVRALSGLSSPRPPASSRRFPW